MIFQAILCFLVSNFVPPLLRIPFDFLASWYLTVCDFSWQFYKLWGMAFWWRAFRRSTRIKVPNLIWGIMALMLSSLWSITPAGSYMFKANNRNTRTKCEICSKLTINTPERRQELFNEMLMAVFAKKLLASFWCLYCELMLLKKEHDARSLFGKIVNRKIVGKCRFGWLWCWTSSEALWLRWLW